MRSSATVGETRVDIALLERIAARDAAALAELYDRQSTLLFSVILRILRDRGEAEDALQEVFVRVWERADTYDRALGTPTAWLVRVARNRAIDRLRARVAREAVATGAVEAPPQTTADVAVPDPEAAASLSQEQRVVLEALARLPDEQRTLIAEAYFCGYTHTELAARFELPLGTVKTRIRTGMLALRDSLQRLA